MQAKDVTREEKHIGWYLVFTKPNHEAIAEQNLLRQGFEIYLPLLQQQKRRRHFYQVVTEPLFPRYIFIHLDSEIHDSSKIRSTLGCISMVRFGALPARVPTHLVQQLKNEESSRMIHEDDCIPDFKPGDSVQVVDGVLANYRGIVENKNSQQRITLLLSLAEGHTRSVNLSIHQIKKIMD